MVQSEVARQPGGRSKGWGLVDYESPEAATAAAEQRTTAERTPTPTSAPTSPLRASRSVVQRVMGWNKRVEKAGAG